MSTFMGAAWLDVARVGDVDVVLADLRTGEPTDKPTDLRAWLGSYAGGSRIELYSDDGYGRLGDLVAGVLRRTGVVWRAVVFLDHDEHGTEHIVVTRDDAGTVRRVHHVYVYPYDDDSDEYLLDEGQPSMTDVPAARGTGRGSTSCALIDNPAARAMTAELFGVSAGVMEAAAGRAVRAQEDQEMDDEPSSVWLEAFGVDRAGGRAGAPVNLRPGPVWRETVAQQVVPRLAGQWLARDYDLVRLPASPVMCLVLPGRWSGHAVINPLYVPEQYGTLQFSVELRSAVVDQAPHPIEPLIHDLTSDALPFFERYGHPSGLQQLCRERIEATPADRANPHDLRCLAATEVILGRYSAAATTYSILAGATADSSIPWVREIADEAHVRSLLLRHQPAVVHDALIATIHQQMTHLGLPPNP